MTTERIDVLAVMDRLLECVSVGVDADDPVRQLIEAGHEGRAAVAELIEAQRQIKHSIQQARIVGNDWRRELELIENTVDAALARVGAP